MLFHVFQIRSGGLRRHSTDPHLRKSVQGWLYFGPTPLDDYGPRMQARLLGPDKADLILPLQYARILRMDGVVHIAGVEYYLRGRKGTPERWKQSWLCAHDPLEALPILDRIKTVSVTGFDDDPPEPEITLDHP